MKRARKRLVSGLSVLAVLLSLRGMAQSRTSIDVQVWPKGEVVLTSGDTIQGPLMFYRSQDVVNVQNDDGTVSSVSPVNVDFFVTYDVTGGGTHLFRTLPWDQGRDYTDFKKPTFFEQLNKGRITLMMRETYLARNLSTYGYGYYNTSYYSPTDSPWMEQVVELYYVLLPDGSIVSLRNVRKDLFRLFGPKSSQVKEYVKAHSLNYDDPRDVVAIVDYFNTLR